jgi:hypothetical protein
VPLKAAAYFAAAICAGSLFARAKGFLLGPEFISITADLSKYLLLMHANRCHAPSLQQLL